MSDLTIQENISLADYTSFRFGGPARYFVEVTTVEQLKEALSWAKEQKQPIFILADGSNMIVSSRGFAGLVIRIKIDFLTVNAEVVEAGAATAMATLVDRSIEAGLAGLEWAGGLPGSFGGAIRGNAGAFGGEIKDTILEVASLSLETGEEIIRDSQACGFVYRGSSFKERGGEVIVSAKVCLRPGDKEALRATADDHIRYRQERHPIEYPNSGSIFKNTPVEHIPPDQLDKWQPVVKNDPFPVVPTAKIIADAGLAGASAGGAQLSTKHTNYIINTGSATGEDVVALIEKIKLAVFQKYRVELEVEPELLGF